MDQDGDTFVAKMQWQIGAVGAIAVGLVLSWGQVGGVFMRWLQASLPQAGTEIATLIAYAIGGIFTLLLIAGVPFASMAFFFVLHRRFDDQEKPTPIHRWINNVVFIHPKK